MCDWKEYKIGDGVSAEFTILLEGRRIEDIVFYVPSKEQIIEPEINLNVKDMLQIDFALTNQYIPVFPNISCLHWLVKRGFRKLIPEKDSVSVFIRYSDEIIEEKKQTGNLDNFSIKHWLPEDEI